MPRPKIYSEEEKRERQRISERKWYEKNKKKKAEQHKKWYEKNKEKKREYNRTHKKERAEQKKEYRQTPAGKKTQTLSCWKKRGLICDNFDMLYENYLSETHCDLCRIKFGEKGDGSGTFRCMDHDHKTGLFRNFLCLRCNLDRG
tara:strand:+ start:41 stop:475 length:435 start_codon:yes stop_codon:yes gene_type:complete